MFNYMRKYNEYNETAQAIKAVKDGWVNLMFVLQFVLRICHRH